MARETGPLIRQDHPLTRARSVGMDGEPFGLAPDSTVAASAATRTVFPAQRQDMPYHARSSRRNPEEGA
jgi:hypothetical protein